MTVEKDECRETFEREMRDTGWNVEMRDGIYIERDTQSAWSGWHRAWNRRAALETKPAATQGEELPPVTWEYVGEELALHWISPYDGKREKIATFWWPIHPIEKTAEVEQLFEAIATRAAMPKARSVQPVLSLADLSVVKHEIADEITFDNRSRSDVVHDVLSATLERFALVRRQP